MSRFYPKPAYFESKSQIAPNSLVFHRTLSDAAIRFLLVLNAIATCAASWIPIQSDLEKRLGWGRDKMKSVIRELKREGFLIVRQSHFEKGEIVDSEKVGGRFKHNDFEFDLEGGYSKNDHNASQIKPSHNECEPSTCFPSTVEPAPEKQPLPMSKETPSKENKYKDNVLRDSGNVHKSKPSSPKDLPKKTVPLSVDKGETMDALRRWKLNPQQLEAYEFLISAKINSSPETLAYWAKTYPLDRIMNVFNAAKANNCTSIGAYMQKLLKSQANVSNSHSVQNKAIAQDMKKDWPQLQITQKYCKFPKGNSFDELDFNMQPIDFYTSIMKEYDYFKNHR